MLGIDLPGDRTWCWRTWPTICLMAANSPCIELASDPDSLPKTSASRPREAVSSKSLGVSRCSRSGRWPRPPIKEPRDAESPAPAAGVKMNLRATGFGLQTIAGESPADPPAPWSVSQALGARAGLVTDFRPSPPTGAATGSGCSPLDGPTTPVSAESCDVDDSGSWASAGTGASASLRRRRSCASTIAWASRRVRS